MKTTEKNESSGGSVTFWDHLDELRSVILRSLAVVLVCGTVAFLLKNALFGVIFAPTSKDFVSYRVLDAVCAWFGFDPVEDFSVKMINTGLARQFMVHLQAAMCVGVLCASPYILYELFRFVSPGLYPDERRVGTGIVTSGYLMFVVGVAFCYFLMFPLTFRFLGTYQVDSSVENMIDLESYMGMFLSLALWLGLVFELPVVAWLFGKAGFISSGFMKTFRRHAIVVILIVAAIITPTTDVFTLLLVSLPMWVLYEASILIVKATERPTENIVQTECS